MKRTTIAICMSWLSLAAISAAQPPLVKSVVPPSGSSVEILPPTQAASPGDAYMTRESRAHEQHMLDSQAAEDSVHRAAVARFEQRTRRLESQRWFGISNTRPTAAVDPIDGDYSTGWASNYPFYPYRWIGGGNMWGFVEGQ